MPQIAYSIDEVCELLAVTPTHIHSWVQSHLIETIIWNDQLWLQAQSFIEFLHTKQYTIATAQEETLSQANETVTPLRIS
jgi:hypothetical protein